MKCKCYSEEIDKCLFDGPPDDCPYQDDHSKCNCFKPIKENKKESKNMKNHKSYSTHICKYYWNNSCHYSEKVFGGSPASCHCVNDFENNCICFEPSIEYEKESSPYGLNSTEVNVFSKLFKEYIKDQDKLDKVIETFESYLSDAFKSPANAEGKCSDEGTLYRVMKERIEDKEEPEVVKRFKKNLDQMMRIKISKLIGDIKDYKFVNHARVIDNCLGNFIVIDCTNDKVYTYSYAEYSWEKLPRESNRLTFQSDKVETIKLMPDNGIDKRALTIQNCDKIILKPKSLEVEVKIEKDNFDDFDFIEINGHKFKKV